MPTKYIRSQSSFIVFHNSYQHRETAIKCLGVDKLIHSAGFVHFHLDNEVLEADCYGFSESLDSYPRPDDDKEILNAIGVENTHSSVEHAKYIICRSKVFVFSNNLDHDTIAKGVFCGEKDCESAGFVKFSSYPNGKLNIQCYGESTSLGVSSKKEDYKSVAKFIKLTESDLFFNK